MHWIKSIIILILSTGMLLATVSAQEATPQPELTGGIQVRLDINPGADAFNNDDVRTTAEIIARRLAGLEIDGYSVHILNGQSIQVQLPPVEDFESVLATISQTALLELVDFSGLANQITEFDDVTLATGLREADGLPNPLTGKPFKTILTGADFIAAEAEVASYDPNQWVINFVLSEEAAAIFGDYTESHVGEPLAITLDGRVLSIPLIQSRLDSQGSITGNFTKPEAEQLAAQLRAGALPLSLTVASFDSFETIILEVNNEE